MKSIRQLVENMEPDKFQASILYKDGKIAEIGQELNFIRFLKILILLEAIAIN